ncbi:MAG: InlB B-repeat-containing protein, partial [Bacteroidales bacterium]|nr:InlB B-repeat-containing protein [Bacteroidales bacterium]
VGLTRYNGPRSYGFSVRCLRDANIDTITFDANNGIGVMPQQLVERGTKVALDSNKFTREGTYAFIGWNTQRNGYGTAYADADSIVTNGNVTLYAQWHTYCSGNIRSNEAGSTRIDSVRDVDNNWYKVIEIGTQCWLAENLRVTHGKNTGAITQANTNTESATQPYYYDYASSDLTLRERGLLYNWSAAVDSTFDALSSESYTNRQGICPDGWHLPSDQEWFVMEKNTLIHDGIWDTVTLAENSGILEERDAHITGAGRWVTGDEDVWESDTHETSPGNFFYSERNMIGLNVIPTGDYKPALHPQHGLTDDGIGANFWTSTTSTQGPGYAVGRDVDNSREAVLRHYYEKEFGRSVRCIRDLPLIPEFSLCEDTTFGNITLSNVKNAEKIEFIQNGTVVKTVNNPATEIIVSDLAEGSYKIKATSSTEDTLVDNARVKHTYTHCTVGTLRANEMGATTTQLDSVRDHQYNWYEVVQIGNQCWLKENMRATTTPGGTNILLGGLDQFVQNNHSKAAFNHSNSVYGVMYNWCAAVDTFNNNGSRSEVAAGAETGSWTCNLSAGNRRGICPEGWHIPADGEFWELEKNTLTGLTPADSATKNYGTARSGIGAGRLAAGCEWYPDNKATSPGNYSYAERNLSGFSARPAGTIEDGSQYANLTLAAYFWSSTPYFNTGAFARVVRTNNECTQRGSNNRYNAFSVRCIRDEEASLSAVADSVSCISMMVSAEVTGLGTITGKTVCAYTNAAMTGSSVCAAPADIHVSGSTITATIKGLDDHTRYYVKVTATDGTYSVEDACTDSTRDMTMEKVTTCTVASVSLFEHAYEGSTTEIDSVYDHEGNAYAVVQIGDQCWLRQNMRCTTTPKQSTVNLTQGAATNDLDFLNAKYYDRTDATMYTINERGYLYNWAAAMDTTFSNNNQLPVNTDFPNHRGICPAGWHLPVVAEWNTMEKVYLTENDGVTPIADATLTAANTYDPDLGIPNPRGKGSGKYTASCGWVADDGTTAPGNYNYPDRNISGFSALPIGCMGVEDGENEMFYYLGESSDFWTATSYDKYSTWARFMLNNTEGIHHNNLNGNKNYGFAVRCVRDVIVPEFSLCEDTTFGNITLREVNNVEKIEFIQNGSVVKTVNNPATEIFVDDLAEGNYKVKVTSSTGDTLVDNARVKHTYTHCTVGQVRGNEMGNNTRLDSVRDHQNNWYEVVQIGNQCWLKQNMRATTKPDGTNILQYPTTGQSTTIPYAYYYNDNSANVRSYGLLYNWAAAMNGAASSAANPSGVRGICPEGWHLPSHAEYTTLMNEVGVTQQTSASGTTTGNSGRLVTGCNWNTYDNATSPGNYSYTERNLSGFSAVPSGNYNGGTTFQFEGERTFLWTATASSTDMAYYRVIAYDFPVTTYTTNTKYSGRSVRCVRDAEIFPMLGICEDNFYGEIKLTEVENAVRVEVLNSGNAVVNTINNPVSGAVLTGLASDTYTVRAISTSGNFAAETANLVKEYTHCTVTSLRENEMGATTTQLDSVKDHQDNWYEVVEIDGKCWLRENMRCTTSPNGYLNVAPSKYWGLNNYYAAPGTAPVYKYGYLYNWSGALDVQETDPASISSLPQNARGICPEGWHIPVIDEWTALRNALVGESTSQVPYSGNTAYAVNTQIATILADGCDWLSDASANNKPGDYGNSNRNSSKFNWRPSPNYYGSNGTASCNTEGRSGYFWSASPNPTKPGYAYMVYLHYTQTGIITGPDNKSHGRNVRCVRNN